jgi:dienelactone hydrolase
MGCVAVAPTREIGPTGSIVVAPIDLGAKARSAHWYLPAGEATALVVFEHGFLRHCENLRETTRQLMTAGLMALCVDASMQGGNPGLAETLARSLADDRLRPDGRAVPRRILVAGHSAGALFAVRMGATLDAIAPERLVGALLFDPVAGDGFETGLGAISAAGRRPVLTLVAPPHRCNADASALPALRRLVAAARDAGANDFELIELAAGATHADVEGEDTSGMAEWSCGRIRPVHAERRRALSIAWARRVSTAPAAAR